MPTVRIDSTSKWDALALVHALAAYRWYLFEPDAEHWQICVALDAPAADLPDDLYQRIRSWMHARELEAATVHTPAGDYTLTAGGA